MKRILNYTLLLLFMIPGGNILGQVLTDEPSKGKGGEGELDGIFCKNKDFQFRLQYELDDIFYESFFFTEEEFYICTSTLPSELVIVNAANQNPIVPYEIVWLKEIVVDGIGGSLSEVGGNLLEINGDDYFEDNVTEINISVTFKLSQLQDPVELELTILENGVEFTQVNDSKYAYDENEIEDYYDIYGGDVAELNTPWNFLLIGPQDPQGNPIPPEILEGKIRKGKGVNLVPKIITNDNNLTINPTQIAPNRKANISFDRDPLVDDQTIEVHACDYEPELFLYAGGLKTYEIRLYRVCESDDDMRVLAIAMPGEQQNLNFFDVCISPGMDGVIDLGDDPNMYSLDHVHETGVVAGANGNCDAAMHPNDAIPDCTNVNDFPVIPRLNKLNELGAKVGIKFELANNGMITNLNLNFDSESDDGKISSTEELVTLANSMEHVIPVIPGNNIIHTALIDDLGNSGPNTERNGRATNLGSDRLILDSGSADGATWFHEIGHAFGVLRHSDDRSPTTGLPTMYFVDDKKNFMYSTPTGRINNVRRYQFPLLRR